MENEREKLVMTTMSVLTSIVTRLSDALLTYRIIEKNSNNIDNIEANYGN
jgi:hypothetical protein